MNSPTAPVEKVTSEALMRALPLSSSVSVEEPGGDGGANHLAGVVLLERGEPLLALGGDVDEVAERAPLAVGVSESLVPRMKIEEATSCQAAPDVQDHMRRPGSPQPILAARMAY